MFEKFSRSWALVKASAGVLRAQKTLLVFPALSAICTIIVTASFFLPMAFTGELQRAAHTHVTPGSAVLMFLFYLVQYFVIIFFNTALIGAVTIHLRGGTPTAADGFRIAMSKLPTIFGYAVISATVGMVLRALQDRAGFIGQWVISLIGMGWSLATFLVVPVLVNSDVGPFDAVKRSAELLKRTWGESLIGNAGIGLIFGLVIFGLVLAAAGLITLAAVSRSAILIGVVIVLCVIAALMLALVQAALQGIYAAAVYRYAEEGVVGGGFDNALVATAFKKK